MCRRCCLTNKAQHFTRRDGTRWCGFGGGGASGQFTLDPAATYRIPIGPGLHGAINATALSPDGRWLAVAGKGHFHGAAGFHDTGRVVPEGVGMTPQMRLEQGTVYLFDTRSRDVFPLRQHLGPVLAMEFSQTPGQTAVLVSAAQEWHSRDNHYVGAIRVWACPPDAEPRYLAGMTATTAPAREKPGLAVTRTGPGTTDILVLSAWSDGLLRVWHVGRGQHRVLQEGQFNNSVRLTPDGRRAFTGSFLADAGRLRQWNVDAASASVVRSGQLEFRSADHTRVCPREIQLLPSASGSAGPLAAVATLTLTPPAAGGGLWDGGQMELQLVNTQSLQADSVAARVPLWDTGGNIAKPAMAVSGDGNYLAVAGAPDHAVYVFRLDDLRSGAHRPQILRSHAAAIQSASLVRNGEKQGISLVLGPTPGTHGTPQRRLVFDIGQRRLQWQQADADWQPETAAAQPWTVRVASPTAPATPAAAPVPAVLRLERDGQLQRDIALEPGQQVTALAVLPPGEIVNVPLVAVATEEMGRPQLLLYSGQTGDLLRQYNGHTERIRSLVASADGRLLLSAGDDQTVCVWSVTDLNSILGKRGRLAGVAVSQDDRHVVVAQLPPDSPAQKELQVGDRLLGQVLEGKLQPWDSTFAFYDAVWQTEPGRTVTVRREPASGAVEDVEVPVGQGADERKPLCWLFVSRAEPPQTPAWIAWSPLGPFDASDREVERYIGWHLNTSDPKQPTRYATIDQYRDTYYRKGLVESLLRHGVLPLADPDPPARPQLSLWFPQLQPDVAQQTGPVTLPIAPPVAQLDIDFAFPTHRIGQVTLLRDSAPVGVFHPVDAYSWQADLADLQWTRGNHQLQVVVTGRNPETWQFQQLLHVRYQPAPPSLQLNTSQQLATQEPRTVIQAEVRPRAAGQALGMRLLRIQQGTRTVLRQWQAYEPLVIREPVDLEAGKNVFALEAYNTDADEQSLADETVLRHVIIHHRPDKRPPLIVVRAVTPVDSAGLVGASIPFQPGQTLQITAPQVQLEGVIQAGQPLMMAQWTMAQGSGPDGSGDAQLLDQFQPGNAERFAILQKVSLRPGMQTVTLLAKTADSEPISQDVPIDYRPSLPVVHIVEPQYGELIPKDTVALKCQFDAPLDPQRHHLAILVNGQPLLEKTPSVDPASRALQVDLPLQLGENTIEIQMRDGWLAGGCSPITVVRGRPLEVRDVTLARRGAEYDVVLAGFAPSEPAAVEVNGMRISPAAIHYNPKDASFQVQQPLLAQAGSPTVTVRLYDRSGTYAQQRVPMPIPAPALSAGPDVQILQPASDGNTTKRDMPMKLRVRSATPLKTVQLFQDKQSVHEAKDLDSLPKGPQGQYVWEAVAPVQLRPGTNHFQLWALNDGVPASAEVTLNCLDYPVEVLIDGIETVEKPGEFIRSSPQSNGLIGFARAIPQGRALIHGRILWPNPDDRRIDDNRQRVQVWVNGFQQLPVELLPRGSGARQRVFKTQVLLGRRQNNVEIALKGLPAADGSQVMLQAQCAQPLRNQRLHLLIVGIGVPRSQSQQLVERALEPLQARRLSPDQFATPIFGQGTIYGPLTGNVITREMVLTQLNRMRLKVAQLSRAVPANDVVLIYYQGSEMVYRDGQFFLAVDSKPLPRQAEGLEHFALSAARSSRSSSASPAALTCCCWTWPATAAILRPSRRPGRPSPAPP